MTTANNNNNDSKQAARDVETGPDIEAAVGQSPTETAPLKTISFENGEHGIESLSDTVNKVFKPSSGEAAAGAAVATVAGSAGAGAISVGTTTTSASKSPTPTPPSSVKSSTRSSSVAYSLRSSSRPASFHRLTTRETGESQVEHLVSKLESIRDNRVEILYAVRKRFLRKCRSMAVMEGYSTKTKIRITDLMKLYRYYNDKVTNKKGLKKLFMILGGWMGIMSEDHNMLQVLEKAVEVAEDQPDGEEDFYFLDFNFYHTVLQPQITWQRNPFLNALCYVLMFYILTPVLFCVILKDEGVCPEDPREVNKRMFYGVIQSLYFASATMSTVGYGDLSITKDTDLQYFIGICYMIVAMLVLFTAFSKLTGSWQSRLDRILKRVYNYFLGAPSQEEFLYQRVARLRFAVVSGIVLQFFVLNLIGFFGQRIILAFAKKEEYRTRSYMATAYWAVQTTTTIGYGDTDMPFNTSIFQIFYLVLSTSFLAGAFGKLGTLQDDIQDMRRKHAWERRQFSKTLIQDLQSHQAEKKAKSKGIKQQISAIDQYQFALASLVNLGKIEMTDIRPIMDKFRQYSENSTIPGYISFEDILQDDAVAEEEYASDYFDSENFKEVAHLGQFEI